MAKSHDGIRVYRSLISITGSHAAAMVLSQIFYWHEGNRLRIFRKGHKWLVKSRAEMCEETGITLQQYKRIIPLLIDKGLIVTERGLFKNRVTPFIRITEQGWALLKQLESKSPKQIESHDSNQLGTKHANLIAITTTTSTSATTEARRTSPEQEDEDEKTNEGRRSSTRTSTETEREEEQEEAEEQERQEGLRRGEAMRARDILKAHQAPLKGNLGAYWKSCVALVDDRFQHHLTGKELGQLKLLSKFLGEQTRPVIGYAVEHWYTFASKAGNASNTSWPPTPNIGFLLKHYHVAVNLLKPEVPVSLVVSEVSLQPIAEAAPEAAVHKLTPQELTELLDGLKSSP